MDNEFVMQSQNHVIVKLDKNASTSLLQLWEGLETLSPEIILPCFVGFGAGCSTCLKYTESFLLSSCMSSLAFTAKPPVIAAAGGSVSLLWT